MTSPQSAVRSPRSAFRRLFCLFCFISTAFAQRLLIPMDLTQTDHLKSYGIAYHALAKGITVEWLLNYRGGSFLMNLDDGIEKECRAKGVLYQEVSPGQEVDIRKTLENSNMDAVMLEKAPKVAVYMPPNKEPWDDAVRIALDYAEIPWPASFRNTTGCTCTMRTSPVSTGNSWAVTPTLPGIRPTSR